MAYRKVKSSKVVREVLLLVLSKGVNTAFWMSLSNHHPCKACESGTLNKNQSV